MVLAVALIGVVLLQRSEGGALGIGGGGMGGFMTGRSAANLLTRTTAILAAAFMLTSLSLGFLAGHRGGVTSIFEQVPSSAQPVQPTPVAPATPAAPAAPAQPAAPSAPTPPIAK
jgi:preprotein translocase subunit SecG